MTRMTRLDSTYAGAVLLLLGCEAPSTALRPEPRHSSNTAHAAPETSAVTSAQPMPEPVHVESVALSGGRIAFVLRGARGPGLGVFLHGLCGHGMGYLQAFQFAASDFGKFVAPHGDVPCGDGTYRSWSQRIEALEEHIELALLASGAIELRDVTLVGYSLGATRALTLARRYPERYRALILIAAPSTPTPQGLAHLKGAVMMAGGRDRQDKMKAAARAFERAKVPSTFLELPEAAHGEMGPEAERVMGEALRWLEERASPSEPSPERRR